MNYTQYKELFDEILNDPQQLPPYDNELYSNYTRLNKSRMKRWEKQLVVDENLVSKVKEISVPQHWIIITEPWCGDAANIVPFLVRIAGLNENVTYEIQLRDTEPFLIDKYLTNGSKSIPKLIVRDQNGKDCFSWGPRPKGAQDLMDELKAANADFDTIKTALQNWYNADKGKSIYKEFSALFYAYCD